MASSIGVQQGDPLGPLLFSYVLIDFSYPVLLSQLDWLFSYGTWMTEPWWVRAPALPPFCKCLYGMVRVLVSALISVSKREVFWPSGNQSFPEFPSSVTRISLL